MSHVLVRIVPFVLLPALAGCGNRLQDREATAGPTSGPGVADVAVAEEDAVAPTPGPPGADAAAPERRWVVYVGELRLLEISDTPGIIVDTNAPPPPPGVEPARHPFLTAACGGDALLCSRAGNLLRESTSLPEFLGKLQGEGWRVEEVGAAAE
jgi:hypothetical protein